MGLRSDDVVERANELLDREDRRLERTLAELNVEPRRARSRAERSRARCARGDRGLRATSCAASSLQLQERRDRLFESMRRDLDAAFQRAHGEVATVIRELQRGGADARDAARAREKLLAIAAQTRDAEPRRNAAASPEPDETLDAGRLAQRATRRPRARARRWRRVLLVSLPDRRGRVGVQVGGARLSCRWSASDARSRAIGSDRAARTQRPRRSARVRRGRERDHGGGIERCDLRGLRVEQASIAGSPLLDRAALRGLRARATSCTDSAPVRCAKRFARTSPSRPTSRAATPAPRGGRRRRQHRRTGLTPETGGVWRDRTGLSEGNRNSWNCRHWKIQFCINAEIY